MGILRFLHLTAFTNTAKRKGHFTLHLSRKGLIARNLPIPYFSTPVPVSIPGTHRNSGTVFVIAVEIGDLSAISVIAMLKSSTCGAKSEVLTFLSTFL